MSRRILLSAGLFALAAAVLSACGAAASQSITSEPKPDPVDWEFTQTADPATPVQTVVVLPATPSPKADPTQAPKQVLRVNWMRTSHAGPGVVTLRFESNVATKALVKSMTGEVGPASIYSENLDEFTTEHVVSVPANAAGRYEVRIEDEGGNVAWGELRYLADKYGLDWGTDANAPALKALTATKLEVDYAFPAGHPSKLGHSGVVRVFSTDAKCTTADACEGDAVGTAVETVAGGNAQIETHQATATIPGSGYNYQVIVGQASNLETTMVFIQLEIRGDQLPKTNVQGPGTIKN